MGGVQFCIYVSKDVEVGKFSCGWGTVSSFGWLMSDRR